MNDIVATENLRKLQRKNFLAEYFSQKEIKIIELKQDLSTRKYFRIYCGGKSYILMDAIEAKLNKLQEFINITKFLENYFRVAKIYHHDLKQGFILEEDLGDNLFNHYLKSKPQDTDKLYFKALDVLLRVREFSKAEISMFNRVEDEFLLKNINEKNLLRTDSEQDYIINFFAKEFTSLTSGREYFCFNDFHADNLFYLKNSEIAIIDYQDAVLNFAAFDVVMLLQDARRYVSEKAEEKYLNYFLKNIPEAEHLYFLKSYDILSLQNNLRILDLFYHAIRQRNLVKYEGYLANVANYLLRVTKKLELKKFKKIIERNIKEIVFYTA